MMKTTIGDHPPLPEADLAAADNERFWLGALCRWRATRKRRAAARRLERSLQTYPDHLLRDMGFTFSGRIRCLERSICRF